MGKEGCPLVQARLHETMGIPDPKAMPPEQYRAGREPDRRQGQEAAGELAGDLTHSRKMVAIPSADYTIL